MSESTKKAQLLESNPNGGVPTRTHLTNMEYFNRYERLRAAATEKDGISSEDHLGFAKWVVARKPGHVASYWRKMKAVALHGLDREGDRSAREAEALLKAETSTGSSKTTSRPSKLKRVPEDDLSRVFEALADRARRSSDLARITALWLRAGRVVGLRPCEWKGTRVRPKDERGGPYLLVPNAKRTNGRSHGEFRTLDLGAVARDDLMAVLRFAQVSESVGPDHFDRMQRGCSELLSRVNAEIWPRRKQRLTLYSARHQFSADCKRLYGRREVAALMGQKTTQTAYRHYARAIVGVDRLGEDGSIALPIPSADDVQRVLDLGPPPFLFPNAAAVPSSGFMGLPGTGASAREMESPARRPNRTGGRTSAETREERGEV